MTCLPHLSICRHVVCEEIGCLFERSRCCSESIAATTLHLAVLGIALSVIGACGGGGSGGGSGAGNPGTPSGNYTITVDGVVGSITRSVQVVLTVQ